MTTPDSSPDGLHPISREGSEHLSQLDQDLLAEPLGEAGHEVTGWIGKFTDATPDPETGIVFAETLHFLGDDSVFDENPDDDIVNPLIGYDPADFPDDIREQILAGEPFEVLQKVTETYQGVPTQTETTYTLVNPPSAG